MKTKEELNDIKAAIAALNSELAELSDDELDQVSGGAPISKPTGECTCKKECCTSHPHLEPLKMINTTTLDLTNDN